jgi:hypothetical protein
LASMMGSGTPASYSDQDSVCAHCTPAVNKMGRFALSNN